MVLDGGGVDARGAGEGDAAGVQVRKGTVLLQVQWWRAGGVRVIQVHRVVRGGRPLVQLVTGRRRLVLRPVVG